MPRQIVRSPLGLLQLEDRLTPSIQGDIEARVQQDAAQKAQQAAQQQAQDEATRKAQAEAIKAAVPTDRATRQVVLIQNKEGNVFAQSATYGSADTGGIDATGGMWVARGDVNGDGILDTVTVPGAKIVPTVKVYDGATGNLTQTYLAYGDPGDLANSFKGGVFVTMGDFNGDGLDDIVVGTDQGGGPRVRIFSGKSSNDIIADFFAIDDPTFRGGVRVAAGDITGDGKDDLVVSAGFGGGPRIAAFNGTKLKGITNDTRASASIFGDFFAFENGLRNGAYLTVGYVNNDKYADVIFGGGPGGAPRVLVLDGARLAAGDTQGALDNPLANFFAGDTANRGGVRVGTTLGDDKLAKILIVTDTGDAIAFNPDGKPFKTINRELGLNTGMFDGTDTRQQSAPIATTTTSRLNAVNNALLGKYTGSYSAQVFFSQEVNARATQVGVTLDITAFTTPFTAATLRQSGGIVQFVGTVVVKVPGKSDITATVTGNFNLSPFPNSDVPLNGFVSFALDPASGVTNLLLAGNLLNYTPGTIAGSGFNTTRRDDKGTPDVRVEPAQMSLTKAT